LIFQFFEGGEAEAVEGDPGVEAGEEGREAEAGAGEVQVLEGEVEVPEEEVLVPEKEVQVPERGLQVLAWEVREEAGAKYNPCLSNIKLCRRSCLYYVLKKIVPAKYFDNNSELKFYVGKCWISNCVSW